MRLTTVLSVALLLACSSTSTTNPVPRNGSLRYLGRGPSGEAVLAGRLEFTFTDDSTLTGTWAIHWLPGADTTLQVGPQVGTGTLVGNRMGDGLLVQLNPGWADNNVDLNAGPTADGYSGQWSWTTATGPRSAGTFVIVRE